MPNDPLRLYLTSTTAAPVAVDVTLLLAASSFVKPAENRTDPRCAEAFDAVTTAYCNGAELYVPLPKTEVEAVPFFFDLWSRQLALKVVPHLELTDEAYFDTVRALAPHLAAYIEGDACDVARWTAYQFTQNIVNPHLPRADMDAIRRAGETTRQLIDAQSFPLLREEIGLLQRQDNIRAPEEYQPLIGTKDVPSFFHLVVAYAISVSIRGCSYAYGLAQIPGAPIYRHHWMRSPALRFGFPSATVAKDPQPSEWIPWGTILRNALGPAGDRPDYPELDRILTELRAKTPRLREELTKTGDRINRHGLTEDEEILIEAMLDVGIAPRYAQTTRAEKLAAWLRDLTALYLPIFKVPVEIVTSGLQPHMLRTFETNLRRTFRRDTFWEVLEDPGIRSALRKYGRHDSRS